MYIKLTDWLCPWDLPQLTDLKIGFADICSAPTAQQSVSSHVALCSLCRMLGRVLNRFCTSYFGL